MIDLYIERLEDRDNWTGVDGERRVEKERHRVGMDIKSVSEKLR